MVHIACCQSTAWSSISIKTFLGILNMSDETLSAVVYFLSVILAPVVCTDFGCSCSHVTGQTLYASCLQGVDCAGLPPPPHPSPPTPCLHLQENTVFFFLSNFINLQFCPKQCEQFAKHRPNKRRCKETSNRYNKSILHSVVKCLFSDPLTRVQLMSV